MPKRIFVTIRNQWIVWGVGIVVVILSMRSLFGPSFFRPHDFTHVARLVEMQRSLQGGEFPVRWSRNFGFGYGMPLFNFYAPLPYYVGQVPLFLGSSSIDAIKFLYIVNGILAFSGMYLLGRELWGKAGGILSATAFSFSTYRAVDLFVRGAIGEAFSMVLLPFLFYGILLGTKGDRKGFILAGVALACILLSHNLTGMLSVVLLVVFWTLTVLGKSIQVVKHAFLGLLLSLSLGIGLSAFYTFPAFFEKGFTRVDQTITIGYFDYHNHFLCASQLFMGKWGYGGSVPGCDDGISFSFGLFVWVLFVGGIVAILRFGKKDGRAMLGVLLLLFLITTGMTIGRSSFIWDHVAILRYFQFPWRFLTFSHVFFAALIGGLGLFSEKNKKLVFLLLVLGIGIIATTGRKYMPEKQLFGDALSQYYATGSAWIRMEISKTLGDYMPPQIKDNAFPSPIESRLTLNHGLVSIKKDDPTHVLSRVICLEDCTLGVNIFQFPGWVAIVDGQSVELSKSAAGLPTYSLPLEKGDHIVEIILKDTPVRVMGNLLSSLALLFLVVLCVYPSLKTARRKAV